MLRVRETVTCEEPGLVAPCVELARYPEARHSIRRQLLSVRRGLRYFCRHR